jgi:thiol-disulfide isomerase/thioredoxin
MPDVIDAVLIASPEGYLMSTTRANRHAPEPSQRRGDPHRRGIRTPGGPRRGRWLAAAGVFAVGVLLVGVVTIWLGQPGEAETGRDGTAPAASTAGDTFPIVAYQGADVLGADELDFSEVLGSGTPVVLNFWAGQCPPCRAEMPDFQRVYDRHAGEFLLIGVDIGPFIGLGTRESAIDLLEELGISYPTAYAVDARAVRDNDVLGMPTTIFYDGLGTEVGRHTGLLTEEALESRLGELLGQA